MGIFDRFTKKTEDSPETETSVERSKEQQRAGVEKSSTGEHGASENAPFGHAEQEEAVNVEGEDSEKDTRR